MTKEKLKEIFIELMPKSLAMSHYDLANETEVDDPQIWKKFLTDNEVAQWIESENSLMQDVELRKLIQNISGSKSVGQAQLINSLQKLQENTKTKEGPAFIYCYIPPNNSQKDIETLITIDNDPFAKEV